MRSARLCRACDSTSIRHARDLARAEMGFVFAEARAREAAWGCSRDKHAAVEEGRWFTKSRPLPHSVRGFWRHI